MRLYKLLLSLSLVLADNDYSDYRDCESYYTTTEFDSPYNTCENNQKMNSSSDVQVAKLSNFSLNDIFCMSYKSDLRCSWSTKMLPKNVQYSASFRLKCEVQDHPLHCFPDIAKESIECQSDFSSYSDMMILVNVSIPGYQCTRKRVYPEWSIEMYDPPEITRTSVQSDYLEIRWSETKTNATDNIECFNYQIKINDEIVELCGVFAYNKTKIDPTRRYRIQMRMKLSDTCFDNWYWSEWSEVVEVGPSENPYQLSTAAIVSIVFLLPMILLALLLVYKTQRLSEKLFPSIPSPSGRVKMFLDKDDFSCVMPPKHFESTEGEIVQVTS